MTIDELKVKLADSQDEIAALIDESPKTFEEFNDLRLRQDAAQQRFVLLQTLHNNMMMMRAIENEAALSIPAPEEVAR